MFYATANKEQLCQFNRRVGRQIMVQTARSRALPTSACAALELDELSPSANKIPPLSCSSSRAV
jgi:hypothetical protein